ncbi:relaxase/mobilization nuclease domain-containing protein [Gordonia sp. NB41Y]|uniref:relaxase/mobilization nuclease domain-containing protein n=1 Tax=Gordonia sp. NB41Y TaxID=875808 RepID=UPI0002C01F2F|nr:relaxase/mobilization nuclease domain-containing protein [Gordonia sp. NB41Y]WLP91772.1 relaxase/mobilization nuclease domain-containing protein [Gordonia sp. NB41Y]
MALFAVAQGPVYAVDPATGGRTAELVDGESAITDELWGDIARDFMREMGFTEEGLAPARWVAVHHGPSKKGNDHIHLAASMVREDGTKVSSHNDFARAQRAAAKLERKYGLAVTPGRVSGAATTPAHSRAEENIGAGKGDEPARRTLARDVRACATAVTSEAEFVRQVRALGHLIRPRYAAGTDDVVQGYSVALTPRHDDGSRDFEARPVWFGGGRLGKDLTLPRRRLGWSDSPSAALEAAGEWRRAKRGREPLKQARKTRRHGHDMDALYRRAHDDLAQWIQYLGTIAVDDYASWASAAGQTAGLFAAWSVQIEERPGPLARAADGLGASASIPAARAVAPKRVECTSPVAFLLLTASGRTDSTVATAVLLRQLLSAVEAIAATHVAAGHAARAAALTAITRTELGALVEATSRVAPAPVRQASVSTESDCRLEGVTGRASDFPAVPKATRKAAPGSPIPARLDPITPANRARLDPARRRGQERTGR